MPEERRQFAILYRDFLFRIVDLELLSSRGEAQRLLAQFAAMLGAFSFTFCDLLRPALRPLDAAVGEAPAVRLGGPGPADRHHHGDRRHVHRDGLEQRAARPPRPPDPGTAAGAPAHHSARRNWQRWERASEWLSRRSTPSPDIAYPFANVPPGGGMGDILRAFFAYWVALLASGLFVCCALLAVQAVAALLLPYRAFLKLSNILQMAAFFVLLGGYFLKPPYRRGLTWVPSFWFLGLFQKLNGAREFDASRVDWRCARWLSSVPLAVIAFFAGVPALQPHHRGAARYRAVRPLASVDAARQLARGEADSPPCPSRGGAFHGADHRAQPPSSTAARGLRRHRAGDRAGIRARPALRRPFLRAAVVESALEPAESAVAGGKPGAALLRGDGRARGFLAAHRAPLQLDLPPDGGRASDGVFRGSAASRCSAWWCCRWCWLGRRYFSPSGPRAQRHATPSS